MMESLIVAVVLFFVSPLSSVRARVNETEPTTEYELTFCPVLASTAMAMATASCSPPESASTLNASAGLACVMVLCSIDAWVSLPMALTATLPEMPTVVLASGVLARVMAAEPVAAVMSESATASTLRSAFLAPVWSTVAPSMRAIVEISVVLTATLPAPAKLQVGGFFAFS